MKLKTYSLLVLLVILASCTCVPCTPCPTWMAVVTPEATPTPADTPDSTPTATATWTPTPEATVQLPTVTGSETPTQIGPGTPSIIEVTPLGGTSWWFVPKLETLQGTYKPYRLQNVRGGPGIDYDVRYRISGGEIVQVYAWISNLPDEAWLCVDQPAGNDYLCTEAVALVYENREYGELKWDQN